MPLKHVQLSLNVENRFYGSIKQLKCTLKKDMDGMTVYWFHSICFESNLFWPVTSFYSCLFYTVYMHKWNSLIWKCPLSGMELRIWKSEQLCYGDFSCCHKIPILKIMCVYPWELLRSHLVLFQKQCFFSLGSLECGSREMPEAGGKKKVNSF